MDGNYGLRFAAILILALGCLYVLAPTFLQAESDELGTVGGADVVETEPALEAWFRAAEGTPTQATADVLEARLKALEVPLERIGFEGDRLVVHLAPGARKDRVEVLATQAGRATLHPLSAVGVEAAGLAEVDDVDAALSSALEAATLDATQVLPHTVAPAAGGGVRVSPALPEGPAVLSVDGRVVGWVSGPGEVLTPTTVPTDVIEGLDAALLASGPLEQTLARDVAEAVEPSEAEDAEEEVVVAETWWEPLLPNTVINRGLDIQGGIDLTLQVELDVAVADKVKRDRKSLQDLAVRDGFEVDIEQDRTRPALKLSHPGDFAALQTWIAKSSRDYAYTETLTADDGTEIHVYPLIDERIQEIEGQAVEQVLETLRKRVDSTGVKEPSIVKMGGGRINIQLPGVDDAQSAIDAIGTQAILTFRMVDEEIDQAGVAQVVNQAEQALPADQFADDDLLNEWLHAQELLPEDRVIRWQYEELADGTTERVAPLQLHDEVVLTGADVNDAAVRWDQNNQPYVMMNFKPRGGRIFCEVTTANVGKRFAIILDEEVRSAPNIREKICGGSASIEMAAAGDPTKEANTLALVLRTGSLTAPVSIGQVREIGASLGADAIRSGVIGSGIGGTITLLFMFVWYGRAGLVADIALVLNVLLVFSLLALFGATLTLPGIAGVALTIGMAVDANIIIYERIREELRLGVIPRKAVDTGYEKGVVAVLDANVTTAIAGIVLYSYGTGPIKGFAVTLLIGIVTTLVTALFVTRTFMEMLTRNSAARLRL